MNLKKDLLTLNYSAGGMKEIRGIVLHSMWGTQEGSIAWFKNPEAKASAHYCISKDGVVVQMVDESKKDMAWHAGYIDVPPAPDWVQPNPNYYCIGIELEDMKDVAWQYPEAQRAATSELVKSLMVKYKIPKEKVVLHKELNPSRRSDPVGAFSRDWVFGSEQAPVGYISFADAITESYQALKGSISNDEKVWRLENWKGLKSLLNDLMSGDSGVKIKWFEPLINEAVTKAISENDRKWQSDLAVANAQIEELRKISVEKYSWQELLSLAWKKWWIWKKGVTT